MEPIGERLAALRKEKGLSQAKLAKLLNLGTSTIANYELNKRTPDPATLKRLADFFDVSVDYLLGRTERREVFKGEGYIVREGEAAYFAGYPLFIRLVERLPNFTEEEKESLLACWRWALEAVEREKKRRPQKEKGF
ncbi:MAG: helix-turn-helix transcriptional regulator [Bacillota bacterium]